MKENEDRVKYLDQLITACVAFFMHDKYQVMKSTADAIQLAKSDVIGLLNYLRGVGAIKGATYEIDALQVFRIYIDADDFTPMAWSCSYQSTGTGRVYPEVKRFI